MCWNWLLGLNHSEYFDISPQPASRAALAQRRARNGAHFAGREETLNKSACGGSERFPPHLTKENGADAEARECVRWYRQFSVDFGGGWIIFCTIYQRFRPLFGYLIGQICFTGCELWRIWWVDLTQMIWIPKKGSYNKKYELFMYCTYRCI